MSRHAQQVSNAVLTALKHDSLTIEEPWLDEFCMSSSTPVIESVETLDDLTLKMSLPEKLRAIVTYGQDRTLGIVGSDAQGFVIVDPQADNFPFGPIVRDLKKMIDVQEYLVRIAAGNGNKSTWTVEFLSESAKQTQNQTQDNNSQPTHEEPEKNEKKTERTSTTDAATDASHLQTHKLSRKRAKIAETVK